MRRSTVESLPLQLEFLGQSLIPLTGLKSLKCRLFKYMLTLSHYLLENVETSRNPYSNIEQEIQVACDRRVFFYLFELWFQFYETFSTPFSKKFPGI